MIDADGHDVRCEKRLIEEARRINHLGKMLAIIIDDARLMEITALRRLRLLLEDFPKNHNLILVAQPGLLNKLALTVNDDIRSRVTYSVLIPTLPQGDIESFICGQLDLLQRHCGKLQKFLLWQIGRRVQRQLSSQQLRPHADLSGDMLGINTSAPLRPRCRGLPPHTPCLA